MDSHKIVYHKPRSGEETTRHRQGSETPRLDMSSQRQSLDQTGGRETTVAEPLDAICAVFPPRPPIVGAILPASQGVICNWGHHSRYSTGTAIRRYRKVDHVPGPLCRQLPAPDGGDRTPGYQTEQYTYDRDRMRSTH